MKASRWAAPALCLLAAWVMIGPVALREGWPHSHEFAAPFERVEAYRRAFVALDFFPTWTPFCFNGHGTPAPFVYHRLFNTVGGLLALPLGADWGTRGALIFFAWLGAFGLYRAARRLEISPTRSMMLACAFIWSPYSLTDWLVRGSAAEFASMMLLPWLFDALLRQLNGERVWLPLGLALAATMHAHQAIGLYLAPLPVLSTAWALASPVKTPRLRVLLDALKAAGLALLLTAPWLIAVSRVGSAYRLDTLKLFLPWNQYVPWHRYLSDDTFAWGATFHGFSVEISRGLIIAAVIALGAAALLGARVARWKPLLFLCIAFLGALVLQFDIATKLYQSVPKAELLQFPWRLVSVMTVTACLSLGLVLEAIARRGFTGVVLATGLTFGVAAAHYQLVRHAQPATYARFTPERLTELLKDLDGPGSAGEYLPRDVSAAPARTPWIEARGCEVRSASPAEPAHFKRLEIELAPGPACVVALSQFATPVLAVEGDGVLVAGKPMIEISVPAGDVRHVIVRRRNLLELALP